MQTLRKALLTLGLLVVLVFSVDTLARTAYCADCSKGGTVDHDCTQEQIDELNSCCQLYGCDNPGTRSLCYYNSVDRYNGCAILHGCPNLTQ